MNWTTAKAWVSSLNVGGFTDWRLPTTLIPDTSCSNQGPSNDYYGGFNCTGSDLGHLFYNELGGVAGQSIISTHNANYNFFSNIIAFDDNTHYWSGTLRSSGIVWVFRTRDGMQWPGAFSDPEYYSWAVRTGDVGLSGVVPEPSIIWLLLAGGAGWLGTKARRRG